MVIVQKRLTVKFLIKIFKGFIIFDETVQPGRKAGFTAICTDILKR